MACGKPPDPQSMTQPTHLHHPMRQTASTVFRQAEAIIKRETAGSRIDRAILRAKAALERAKQFGASSEDIKILEGQLKNLIAQAHNRLRETVDTRLSKDLNSLKFTFYASKRNVETVISALRSDSHWASKAYRANLISMIEGNQRIPDRYKAQLHKDVARVLELCPLAGGLARELTLRGQRGATGSKSKLGSNSNSAIGAAYEIMGTAALSHKVSQPKNINARSLHIQIGHDIVTFGDKSYLNGRHNEKTGAWQKPSRSTVECDIRIFKPALLGRSREIGVDFKHVKEARQRNSSADFKSQLEHVARAIREGHFDEYHFVTNGSFGVGFCKEVEMVNVSLVADGHSPIGYHQYVNTISADPVANGQAFGEVRAGK